MASVTDVTDSYEKPDEISNKAVCMITSVAYGRTEALMRFKEPFGKNFNIVTDGRTNQPTD